MSNRIPSPLVETDWLARHLGEPDLRILDCSVLMLPTPDGAYAFRAARAEWEQGHIPGSDFVDAMAELADKRSRLPMMMPPAEEVAEALGAHGVGEGTRVVLYDRGNHSWAARVWWMLRACGFDDAAVLNGGWIKWVAEQRPISSERASFPKTRFSVRPRPELFVGRDDVLRALRTGDKTVVNALSPEEHSGKVTRLPRPGRIAGSTNVYYQALLDPKTHAFLPVPVLRKLFADAGVTNAKRVITYCGGGIAASSDALALTLLGANAAVYDGSLVEWTADPSLPMETDHPGA